MMLWNKTFISSKCLRKFDRWLTQWLYDYINSMYNSIGSHQITLDNRHSVHVYGGVTLKDIKKSEWNLRIIRWNKENFTRKSIFCHQSSFTLPYFKKCYFFYGKQKENFIILTKWQLIFMNSLMIHDFFCVFCRITAYSLIWHLTSIICIYIYYCSKGFEW